MFLLWTMYYFKYYWHSFFDNTTKMRSDNWWPLYHIDSHRTQISQFVNFVTLDLSIMKAEDRIVLYLSISLPLWSLSGLFKILINVSITATGIRSDNCGFVNALCRRQPQCKPARKLWCEFIVETVTNPIKSFSIKVTSLRRHFVTIKCFPTLTYSKTSLWLLF